MVNPFENVRTRSVTIKKEFTDLLQIISPDRGYTEEGKNQNKEEIDTNLIKRCN